MSSTTTTVTLLPEHFGRAPTVLARHGRLVASTFRFAGGVAALRIENGLGEMTLLPFQGQQIWRASFLGRELTMRSMFEEPVATRDYLSTYGALFIHCGVTAMGNPSAQDTHPLHGELPNAPYDSAELLIGSDAAGPFMGLTGCYRHAVAFTHNYVARPTVHLNEGSSRIHVALEVENKKRRPMELMYLAHVNLRPADGARIVDSVARADTGFRVRQTLPEFFVASPEYLALRASIVADPGRHRRLPPGQAVDPELVIAMNCAAGADGWSHALQVHGDGIAEFVSHRPDELGHAIRWIVRNPDQDALGLVLPATAEADGYTAEKAKGNLRVLEPGQRFHGRVSFGLLAPDEVPPFERAIEAAVR